MLSLWENFLYSLARIEMLLIGFLSLVPVQIVEVWGLPICFAVLPFILLAMKKVLTDALMGVYRTGQ